MTASTNDQPVALRPTFADRRAAKEAWEATNPVDPTADLVCIYDQREEVEDRRTKESTTSSGSAGTPHKRPF